MMMPQPTIHFLHMGMSVPDVAVRFMGHYEAQFRGLRQAGAHVTFDLAHPDPHADFIVCTADAHDIQRAATQTKRPLILYVAPIDQWFERELLSSLRERILFAYGPVLSGMTEDAYCEMGIAYHFLPLASDPEINKPLNLEPEYDLAFLGGLEHRRGYQPYIEPLLKQLDPRRLAFLGGKWQHKYKIPVTEVHGLTADAPPAPHRAPLVNQLHNLARVCINFHAPEQMRGPKIQLDCNNRVFDLAMAGCLQVSDNPDAVRMHFGPDEVFAEATPETWVNRVLDCLSKPPAEFTAMRQAARERALNEHTWFHRGQTMLSWIDQHTH
jgi:hypothetical protein